MSLLQKFLAATPVAQPRELVYGKLINALPAAPVEVDGEMVAKICATVDFDGEVRNLYIFRDSVTGLPTFIPKGGLQVAITFQQSKETNPKTGEAYINAVAMGVGA